MSESSFLLTDLTSLSDPKKLVKGDGNTFLNFLILLLGALCFFGVKTNHKDKSKIIIAAVSFAYFIYIMNLKFGTENSKSGVTTVDVVEEVDNDLYERMKNGQAVHHLFA